MPEDRPGPEQPASTSEIIIQGVKDHAGFSETTPLTGVREKVFQ